MGGNVDHSKSQDTSRPVIEIDCLNFSIGCNLLTVNIWFFLFISNGKS